MLIPKTLLRLLQSARNISSNVLLFFHSLSRKLLGQGFATTAQTCFAKLAVYRLRVCSNGRFAESKSPRCTMQLQT